MDNYNYSATAVDAQIAAARQAQSNREAERIASSIQTVLGNLAAGYEQRLDTTALVGDSARDHLMEMRLYDDVMQGYLNGTLRPGGDLPQGMKDTVRGVAERFVMTRYDEPSAADALGQPATRDEETEARLLRERAKLVDPSIRTPQGGAPARPEHASEHERLDAEAREAAARESAPPSWDQLGRLEQAEIDAATSAVVEAIKAGEDVPDMFAAVRTEIAAARARRGTAPAPVAGTPPTTDQAALNRALNGRTLEEKNDARAAFDAHVERYGAPPADLDAFVRQVTEGDRYQLTTSEARRELDLQLHGSTLVEKRAARERFDAYVDAHGAAPPDIGAFLAQEEAPVAPAVPRTYTVAPGDNLTRIARQHGTTVEELVRLNSDRIRNPDHIEPEWELTMPEQRVPEPVTQADPPMPRPAAVAQPGTEPEAEPDPEPAPEPETVMT